VASWYDSVLEEWGTEFHQEVIIPGALRLLELQPGEKVLDLACGQGVVSRALLEAGARVTGVDLSPQLIQIARRRSPRAISYLVGNARHLGPLPDQGFDAMVFILAAQNIDPIEPVFAECARLLAPGGRLVMVLSHPAFRIPRQSSWRRDEGRKLLYRAVDRYLTPLKIPVDIHPFKQPGQKVTWTYHRPIQVYIKGLSAVGLWVNAFEEWPSHKVSQPGPAARTENRARAEFPLFLALRAVHVPAEWLVRARPEPSQSG
jgi:ubiquinone/menaquinone biosynthesis C-methylase UbiE